MDKTAPLFTIDKAKRFATRPAPRRVPIPCYWDWMAIGEWHKAFGYEEPFGGNSWSRLKELIRLNWHIEFFYEEVQVEVIADIINNTARFRRLRPKRAKAKTSKSKARISNDLLEEIENL